MTDLQRRLLDLLREFDALCTKANCLYTLIDNSLLLVMNEKKIAGSEIDIAMMFEDYCKFSEEFERLQPENRAVESIEINSKMPGWYFRYVDTSTTYLAIDYANVRKMHCIGLNIHIVRKKTYLSPYDLYLSFCEKGLMRSVEKNQLLDRKYSGNGLFAKQWVKFLRGWMGTNVFSKYFSTKFPKLALQKANKKGKLVLSRNWIVDTPKDFLSEVIDVSWHLDSIKVSRKYSDYLRNRYGLRWNTAKPEYRKQDFNNIASVKVPFRECQNELRSYFDNDEYWRTRRYFLKNSRGKVRKELELRRQRQQYYEVARNYGLDWKKFYPLKHEIQQLWQNEQYDELWIVLKRYRNHVEEYAGLGIAFVVDEDIWNITVSLFEMNGYGIFAKKLKKLPRYSAMPVLTPVKEGFKVVS